MQEYINQDIIGYLPPNNTSDPKDIEKYSGIYDIMRNDHKDNKKMNQKIFDFFRKKPDVINSKMNNRNDLMEDPGFNLAMELFQDNAL